MSESAKLIDTSTLSEVIKGHNPEVTKRAQKYLDSHRRFSFSILTRFEILRGLHAKQANKQIDHFERFCMASRILPLDDAVVVQSAEIYGWLRRRGNVIDDVDILIAATALVNGMELVTENIDHFRRIPALQFESWRPR